METKSREFGIDILKDLLDQTEINYKIITEEEDSFIRLKFSSKKTKEITNVMLKPADNRLLILILDVQNIADVENKHKLFEEILKFNSREVLYGTLGYEPEIDSITYTNGISLDSRSTLHKEEFLDYIAYALFIVDKTRRKFTIDQSS
ncbi:hypothetical protein [Bacillus cereus]|uniref:hypothetical protein n=1 Tax=Bacillus cereus TaxID=1396 RepID=UPI0009956E13|nr:hypothetical protein [Bacillus cereus]OOZ91570.1 hypothetical protein BHL25_01065 [Bacillus cereus]